MIDNTESKDVKDQSLSDHVADSVEMQEVVCCICQGTKYHNNTIGVPDCCTHKFCGSCLTKWSEAKNTCPLDRMTFSRFKLYKVENGTHMDSISDENLLCTTEADCNYGGDSEETVIIYYSYDDEQMHYDSEEMYYYDDQEMGYDLSDINTNDDSDHSEVMNDNEQIDDVDGKQRDATEISNATEINDATEISDASERSDDSTSHYRDVVNTVMDRILNTNTNHGPHPFDVFDGFELFGILTSGEEMDGDPDFANYYRYLN